jgi:hypothetical protein
MFPANNPQLDIAGITIQTVKGRAVAKVVTSWLPNLVARVRAQVRLCMICGGQSGCGAGFLRVLRFPLTILIT